MIPEEVQAFFRSVKDATAATPPAPRSMRHRATAGDAGRALAELLVPALADPAKAAKAAGLRERILTRHAAARRAAQAEAAARSAGLRREVLAAAAQRVDGARIAADLPLDADAVPRWYVLTQPYLIWPTGLVLDDLQSVDLESYVRFRVILDPGTDKVGYVRFHYYWTNPFPDVVFVDLGVVGAWNGYCDVYLNGGFDALEVAGADVEARLEVFNIWAPNASFVTMDRYEIFTASLQDTGLSSGYKEENAATSGGWMLHASYILVPPNRTVVFTMTAFVSGYSGDDGGVSIDYSSGGYLFGSPAAVVTVVRRVVST
jgi:hypothetical protein